MASRNAGSNAAPVDASCLASQHISRRSTRQAMKKNQEKSIEKPRKSTSKENRTIRNNSQKRKTKLFF